MTDLHKKSIQDLKKELAKKREELREFRFKNTGSHTRDVREGRNTRRAIAHILTELNARSSIEN